MIGLQTKCATFQYSESANSPLLSSRRTMYILRRGNEAILYITRALRPIVYFRSLTRDKKRTNFRLLPATGKYHHARTAQGLPGRATAGGGAQASLSCTSMVIFECCRDEGRPDNFAPRLRRGRTKDKGFTRKGAPLPSQCRVGRP